MQTSRLSGNEANAIDLTFLIMKFGDICPQRKARSGETLHGQPPRAVFELDEWLSQLICSKPQEWRNLKTLSACRSYQEFQPKEKRCSCQKHLREQLAVQGYPPSTEAVLTRHYLRKKAG